MLINILVGSFVVVCVLMVISASLVVMHRERRQEEDEIILAAEPLRPEWIYGRRMDVPGKFPALRTRRSKVLR